ncbi:uncharacterized protein LOC127130213 [Lathyrus oleraceus]|uniref:uncharacterized protein LOC127130213 n=1 Tax=Pisum sativum TaxID=3888 RepID=UPI0021CF78B7|nr:uncharacterized protein LOC127130213 [Pisum sativum]
MSRWVKRVSPLTRNKRGLLTNRLAKYVQFCIHVTCCLISQRARQHVRRRHESGSQQPPVYVVLDAAMVPLGEDMGTRPDAIAAHFSPETTMGALSIVNDELEFSTEHSEIFSWYMRIRVPFHVN